MKNKPETWQDRFGLTTCAADEISKKIPATAQGVAVIYTRTNTGETIFLVVESRTSGLRGQGEKRLQTAKLPPIAQLTISFKAEALPDAAAETIHTACREQVIFAGELRRELRPAMR